MSRVKFLITQPIHRDRKCAIHTANYATATVTYRANGKNVYTQALCGECRYGRLHLCNTLIDLGVSLDELSSASVVALSHSVEHNIGVTIAMLAVTMEHYNWLVEKSIEQ